MTPRINLRAYKEAIRTLNTSRDEANYALSQSHSWTDAAGRTRPLHELSSEHRINLLAWIRDHRRDISTLTGLSVDGVWTSALVDRLRAMVVEDMRKKVADAEAAETPANVFQRASVAAPAITKLSQYSTSSLLAELARRTER